MIDLKKLLITLKQIHNKGIIKPRYFEFEIEGISTLNYSKVKNILKEQLQNFNLEFITTLEYKLEEDNLILKLK